ncbi:hypothetical protein ACFXPA_41935 [Amycolatopsis sp. NPDC059090]|uniref:hypothetical protein n=1 Tax=unclassified Amycolatopsis TaxID=2618356 RepID=UPI003672BF68
MLMLDEIFVRDLRKFAREIGVGASEFESGHARWDVYFRAMRLDSEIDQLIALIGREPDRVMATSVVLSLLEQGPRSLRERAVGVLPVGASQDFARARMVELSVLEELVSGSSDAVEPNLMDNWSHWLQLRAAKLSSHRQVLEYLASAGATKRIRREALARAKEICD